jgi:hypothetical protein
LFGSMLANALKQLTTLKSGHPAPCKVSSRNAGCLIPVAAGVYENDLR